MKLCMFKLIIVSLIIVPSAHLASGGDGIQQGLSIDSQIDAAIEQIAQGVGVSGVEYYVAGNKLLKLPADRVIPALIDAIRNDPRFQDT